jgi:lysophospholipase L1-like esterase
VNPKVIVLLGGTNNLQAGGSNNNVNDITKGLKAVVDICQKKAPEAVIIVMGILPRNDNMGHMTNINKVNENLAKMADGKKIRFVNVNEKMTDKDGKLLDGMMNSDKLHPDTKGYQVMADALKPIFTEILGPAGKEDHAPRPSADPSATAGRNTRRGPATSGPATTTTAPSGR